MPSFTTISRALVMLGVGAIGFKGWQMYGPPAEQVKSAAGRAADMAKAAWTSFQKPDKPTKPAAEPQGAAPPFAQALQSPSADVAITPPALSTQTLTPNPATGAIPRASAAATQVPITPLTETTPPTSVKDDRVPALLSRL